MPPLFASVVAGVAIWLVAQLAYAQTTSFVVRSDEQQARLERLRDAGKALAVKRCSPVIRAYVKRVRDPNRLDGKEEFLRKSVCSGFEVEVLHRNIDGKKFQFPWSTEVTDPARRLPLGIRLGIRPGFPERLFGAPDLREAELVHYYVHNEGPGADGISFYLNNGLVGRIVWAFHVE